MITVSLAPEWRRTIDEIVAEVEAGPASISISSPPGSGSATVFRHLAKRLTGIYEHVVRFDGSVFGVAESALRTWLVEAGADLGADTFAAARAALRKEHYVIMLVDRASPDVLSELLSGDLGGAVIASITPGEGKLASTFELAPYPSKRSWSEVRRRRAGGLVIAGNICSPHLSAISAVSRLSDGELRGLLDGLPDDGSEHIELQDVLAIVEPKLTDQCHALLRALILVGPGDVSLASLGSIRYGLRHQIAPVDLGPIAAALGDHGLIQIDADTISVDDALVAALDPPDAPSAKLRRSASHLATQLRGAGESASDAHLDTALRLLHWAALRNFSEPQITVLREFMVERLVEAGLLESALRELNVAIAVATEDADLGRRARNRVDAGLVARNLGRFGRSVRYFEEALSDFGTTKKSQIHEAIALSNIGMVQQQVGSHAEAVDTLDRARAILQRARGNTNLDDASISISLIVSLLQLGERSRAAAELRAVDRLLDQCDPSSQAADDLRNDVERLKRLIT